MTLLRHVFRPVSRTAQSSYPVSLRVPLAPAASPARFWPVSHACRHRDYHHQFRKPLPRQSTERSSCVFRNSATPHRGSPAGLAILAQPPAPARLRLFRGGLLRLRRLLRRARASQRIGPVVLVGSLESGFLLFVSSIYFRPFGCTLIIALYSLRRVHILLFIARQ